MLFTETISKPVKLGCWANILRILRRLAISPVGFQIICEAFAQDPEHLEEAVSLFIYGLSSKGKAIIWLLHVKQINIGVLTFISDINVPVMRFIIDLLIISQTTVHPFDTFAEQLNDLRLSAQVKESTKKFMFNADISSQSVVNWFESSDTEETDDYVFATEILFSQLAELFGRFCDPSSNKLLPNRDKCFVYTCKSLETLLKCSDKARTIATEDKFLLSIVGQMEDIVSDVGGSFTEFVRKYGNGKVSYIRYIRNQPWKNKLII